jgi:hypothetical protein
MTFVTDAQRKWFFANLDESRQRLDAFVSEYFDAWATRLSAHEREILRDYQNVEYEAVNGYLRGKSGPLNSPANWRLKIGAENVETVLASAPSLAVDTTVYRGFKVSPGQSAAVFDTLRPGMEFEDLGFQSTSLDMHTAMFFSGPRGVVARIAVPAGTPAAALHAIDENRQGPEAEFELLLPRGARYRVRSVETGSGGRTYIDLDWIGHSVPVKRAVIPIDDELVSMRMQ